MDFPSLQFSENCTDHSVLKHSAKIANKYLETMLLKSFFACVFNLDPIVSKNKIKNVRIKFQIQSKKSLKKNGLALAWSHRFINAKVIYINQIFKKRLDILQKSINLDPPDKDSSKEIMILTVYISLVLLHELANLLLRWKGILHTPSNIGEAGDRLESAIFSGQVRGIFTPKKAWSQNSKLIYIAIEWIRRHRNEINYLSFDYIKKVHDLSQNLNEYINFEFCEKLIERDVIILKQSEELSEVDEEKSPSRLEVARRLYNIDVTTCGT